MTDNFDFKSLPKVELHLHLDCSLSYEVVHLIDPTITREEYLKRFVVPEDCPDLETFLSVIDSPLAIMQTPFQLKAVVEDLFKQLIADHIIYAEVRFAPLEHMREGLQADEVVNIIKDEVARCMSIYPVEVRVILCTLRHYTPEQSMQTVKLVHRHRGDVVVGFDIAGDEYNYPLDNHRAAFEYAGAHQIFCTAHAGEARGADSVRETLEMKAVTRIGHGVRSIEDDDVIDILKERNIHLEVCPCSNLKTKIANRYEDHPVHDLYQKGVSISINTDSKAQIDTSLIKEYELLNKHHGWSKAEFLEINLEAIQYAFVDENVKDKIIGQLKEAYL